MPYRSWLFVPGDSPRKIEKAAASEADILILDLEDSVSPDRKAEAREITLNALKRVGGPPKWVRVNALDTNLTRDDVAAVGSHASGLVLPKCGGPDDLAALDALSGGLPVLAIATETVRAVRACLSADWTHPTLSAMTWGAEDLAADLGASANRGQDGRPLSPFRFARDAMLFAAKAAGVPAIDTVFVDFRDEPGLVEEAREAEASGFSGKMAIHPAQVAPINAAFTPGGDAVDWARRVVAAMEAAGEGVARLDGRMLDRPHLKRARSILARAGRDRDAE